MVWVVYPLLDILTDHFGGKWESGLGVVGFSTYVKKDKVTDNITTFK